LLAVLTALLLNLVPSGVRSEPAASAPRRRVLLLVDRTSDLFMGRIKAEIASLGLDVIVHPAVGSLEADARAEHAVAAIRMLPSRKGVEVWMADETSGRSLLRQVIVDETPGGPDQNLIALQTAELLRTSFFPRSERPSTPVPPPPPPIVLVASAPQPSGESIAQAGLGVLWSAGGASTSLQAWLSLQHRWGRHLGVAIDLSAPITRGSLSGPEGTSEVGTILAGAEVLVRFPSEKDRVVFTTGLGAAFAAVIVTGHPGSKQLVGRSSSAYTGLAYLRLEADWKLTSWLGLGAMGVVGTTPGPVDLTFAGNAAGSWGTPVLGGLLLAEVGWR
jgi:hypothetical protein